MNESANRISDVASLVLGDTVEVRRFDDVLYRGHVDAVAQRLGVAWVRDHLTGCRAMLHGDLFNVFVLRRSPLHAPAEPMSAGVLAAA
ncbi:hypothetical protein [Zhihengliuella halotolerans]|uniref:hypothetical protein n=1 Tax=Zhihengliuella halotolerans TaxID=370736 RepID=UPI000C80532C|nr:hypothetical protein [Zhihengliuella halotolerans]